MGTSRQRISARDYKNASRSTSLFDFSRYSQFGIGLGVGLVVALFVWLYDNRVQPRAGDDLAEVTKPDTRVAKAAAVDATDSDDPDSAYSFYEVLPKVEVTVPEQDHGARHDLPAETVVLPGSYVLQIAANSKQADAERLRDKLNKMGLGASIQHVTVDKDEWFRVRIGPISDLAKLNATRKQLRMANIDAWIYRVGD